MRARLEAEATALRADRSRLNASLLMLKGVRSLDINLTLRNLFSELYESNGWSYAYLSEGRRQSMVGLYPQAPLNLLGGITLAF